MSADGQADAPAREHRPPRQSRRRPPAARPKRRGLRLLAGVAVLGVVGLGAAAVGLDHLGIAPRALAPYIEKRTTGHNPAIVGVGQAVARTLVTLDRQAPALPANLVLGAQPEPAAEAGAGTASAAGTLVTTPDALLKAMMAAQAGDVITLAPGTYRFSGRALDTGHGGRAGAPIVVRAGRPGTVQVEFAQTEGFRVSLPYWRFENLTIRGVCSSDSDCEHAFHVVGAATHFASVNNTITDFNAHFKINGIGGAFPDDGLIASNTLSNTRVRDTSNPVTPIDLVAASRWTIRANVIMDFAKGQGNAVSYGAFAKGGGSANVFERNLVWCENAVHGPGQRVGLSLGGGGTGHEYCRDGKCVTEQQGSTIRANLIASCSDAAVYLNSAAGSRVDDNTMLDTTGVEVRFPTSSARLDGNLIDGPVRSRDGGLVHEGDNRTSHVWTAYLGRHPVRAEFASPADGNLGWRDGAPARAPREGPDLCGATPLRAYGAFNDFGACLRR